MERYKYNNVFKSITSQTNFSKENKKVFSNNWSHFQTHKVVDDVLQNSQFNINIFIIYYLEIFFYI